MKKRIIMMTEEIQTLLDAQRILVKRKGIESISIKTIFEFNVPKNLEEYYYKVIEESYKKFQSRRHEIRNRKAIPVSGTQSVPKIINCEKVKK